MQTVFTKNFVVSSSFLMLFLSLACIHIYSGLKKKKSICVWEIEKRKDDDCCQKLSEMRILSLKPKKIYY